MRAIIEGLLTVLKHLFMTPVTLEYPEKKRFQSDEFRGRPEVKLGENGCVGCGICKQVCPSGAIEYVKNEKNEVVEYRFDLKKCMFCGNCKYYCPRKAINLTEDFELGVEKNTALVLNYHGGDDDR